MKRVPMYTIHVRAGTDKSKKAELKGLMKLKVQTNERVKEEGKRNGQSSGDVTERKRKMSSLL